MSDCRPLPYRNPSCQIAAFLSVFTLTTMWVRPSFVTSFQNGVPVTRMASSWSLSSSSSSSSSSRASLRRTTRFGGGRSSFVGGRKDSNRRYFAASTSTSDATTESESDVNDDALGNASGAGAGAGATASTYPFTSVEAKWQKRWDEWGTFRTPERDVSKPKKYVLDMFPYPSGAGLHVGHPEGYTASDVMSRYWRMVGYDVLHPIGWDSFGLPAEQYAIQTGARPEDTTLANINNFRRQLKSLGFSYDWERELATTDTSYVKWTQWIFLQLFHKGLAEQSSVAVNWCPALGTVLANEEVINGRSERGDHPVERVPLRQWILRITDYADRLEAGLDGLEGQWPSGTLTAQRQWIGKSRGCRILFDLEVNDNNNDGDGETPPTVEVFTTRPDTLMGVTYVTLAPEHPLVAKATVAERKAEVEAYVTETSSRSDLDRTSQKEKTGVFTGSYAIHPLDPTRKVPVWVGDYVLGSYGTGAVMAVPSHDDRDFEFAEKYGLEKTTVVVPSTSYPSYSSLLSLSEETNATNTDDDEEEAEGAFTGEGVLVNSGDWLDGKTTAEAKEAIAERLSSMDKGGPVTTYKLRDWVFSRQRYWGEPIPIYFPIEFDDDTDPATLSTPAEVEASKHTIRFDQPIPVDESDLPLELPEMEDFSPGEDPAGCLARATDWRYFQTNDADGDVQWYARETNTMPQWAGSCWYYLRFTDPKNDRMAFSPAADRDWMPVDLYVGGAEHAVLHLLYARFWHQVLYDLGYAKDPEPFGRLVHQGMILGADGEKMSKSRGNVVNPDDVVRAHGADALRLYEMFMGPLEAVKPWQTSQVQGVVRFQNRLYALLQNVLAVKDDNDNDDDIDSKNANKEVDEETLRLLHKTMKKVTADIESMSFNTAISALMVLTNHLQSVQTADPTVDLTDALENLILMVYPFAPHLGEECWSLLHPSSDTDSPNSTLTYRPWVVYDEELCVDNTVTMGVQINGKRRGEIVLAVDADQETAMEEATRLEKVQFQLEGKDIKKIIYVPGKILNIVAK